MTSLKISPTILSLFLILIIAITAFSPCLKNEFTNCDDNIFITANPKITDLSWKNTRTIFTTFHDYVYVPLVLVSFAIEYHFFKLDPFPYHCTNLILHLLNCCLVFWMISMLSRSGWVAFITALLFAIHPLRVESVAWVTERKDVLYSFFFLGTIVCYLLHSKERSRALYGCSLLLFVLSMLSKPAAITMPLVLLLIDYFCHRKLRWQFLLNKIPFFVIAAVFGILGIIYYFPLKAPFTFFQKFIIVNYSLVFYLAKTFAPVKLSCLYPYPGEIMKSLHPIMLLSPLLVIPLITATAVAAWKYHKYTFGALFFLITLLPSLTLFPFDLKFPCQDRFTYIPSIGLFYLFGEFSRWIYLRGDGRKTTAISLATFCAATVITFSYLSWRQCAVWKDSISLWTDVIGKFPRTLAAYKLRGLAYAQKNDYENAILDCNRIIAIDPGYIPAYSYRANINFLFKKYDLALADYDLYLQINSNDARALLNRALIYLQKKEYSNARRDVKKLRSMGYKVDLAF